MGSDEIWRLHFYARQNLLQIIFQSAFQPKVLGSNNPLECYQQVQVRFAEKICKELNDEANNLQLRHHASGFRDIVKNESLS